MARRSTRAAAPIIAKTLLPHDWRDAGGHWKIIAMLARIPPTEYLSEVRRFEQDAIAAGTLSDDWMGEWKAFCWRRFKPEMICAFCRKETDGDRVMQINPATADSSPEFGGSATATCQANWETGQLPKRPRLFG